jgi:dTDP-4-amino-4,6-dideoxy-D-galactose acyltransferase
LLDHLPTPLNNSRKASKVDIPYLKKVASQAVNDFDRYHADPFFTTRMANNYLETYIENCVNGFSECVFVPDLDQVPYSFVALSRLKEDSWFEKEPLFRIPLTACLPENKGWHYLLCLEALHYAKNNNAKCLVMTTQTTNKAVIHNCEKLGFKLGSCTHIFSKSF